MKRNLIFFFIFLIYLLGVDSFQPNEEIKVIYLEAPLFYSKYGALLANISAFHSGLGFISETTDEQYTIDFVAYPGVLESVLPKGVIFDTIMWDTGGKVQVKDYINGSNYWVQSQEIMTIDGDIFETFVCWANNYNKTYTWYQLFDVIDSLTNETEISSRICNDFVWEGVNALYNLGGNYINETDIISNRDFITIYSIGPPNLIQDGGNNKEVIDFYSAMLNISHISNQTVAGLVDELDTLFNGHYYLYYNDMYYNITLASSPVSFTYDEAAFASGERSKDNIQLIGNCYNIPHNLTPSNKKLGGGWVFLIVLICFSTTYFIGGALINRFYNQKSGLDIIPNRDSWSKLGGLISDGASFIKNKIIGSTYSATYNSIA
ncbi:hypothetical protein DICPUDRAFT_157966 [Dictyostelium purpureum]|uniref:Solute-binding protein family 3/N-terminal domain-containing protein n=1 Tax=Dictyostelium purpureum TaxID=5786 RepID=F1A0H2_DICPU|nr:uncharacterized protein DICPUDRAFT_157966 [Dictyostelium purpureum]EGC30316.1 hypothetical protein DICPUDRAFT_157966 [Dictyostelium purpureum]|eukprot:XP_003293167.1 hypothetical protein DICPUDRAFT_157966 [Dictyostelium purpureum]